jgi:hypothetical protein
MSLCTGYGAVPSRIQKVAPFLRDLPATQHAHQALFPDGATGWQHAARELLNCVTKPGGAAGFNERSARFVRACLALEGALESYTQRMDDLSNDPDFAYWRSRNAQDKQRDEAMEILAARLLQLKQYPCAPSAANEAIEEILDLVGIVVSRHLSHLEDHERQEVYDEIFRRLAKASAFFDGHAPSMSLRERLEIIVTAIAARPYRQLYDGLTSQRRDQLVPPDEVWKLFEDRPSLFDPESPEVERTMRLIERIALSVEERGTWENTLLAVANAKEGTTSQSRSAVDLDDDELDYPDWLT